MSNIIIYDTNTKQVLRYLTSVNTPDYSSRDDVVINPIVPEGVPLKFLKEDNGNITEMTSEEQDAIVLAELQAQQAIIDAEIASKDDVLSKVNLGDITLAKVDNAINNISNLDDAKVFLKKMCRYIVLRESGV